MFKQNVMNVRFSFKKIEKKEKKKREKSSRKGKLLKKKGQTLGHISSHCRWSKVGVMVMETAEKFKEKL